MAKQEEHLPAAVWWRGRLAPERREMRRVLAELMAARGLMPLLMKTRNGGRWTPQEKKELLTCLRRLSPYLLLLILPGSALFLPAYARWLDQRRMVRPVPPALPAKEQP